MGRSNERLRIAGDLESNGFRSWLCGGRTGVQMALLTVQLTYGGYYVLTKVAMSGGVNPLVFAVYRDSIALILLGPLAFFTERRTRPALTCTVLLLTAALGFTGIFLQQMLFLTGLAYTNTAFAAAMQNAIPVFTFMIAVISKLEVIRIKKADGVAKVVGILAAVTGALTMCIYKGPTLLGTDPRSSSSSSSSIDDNMGQRNLHWVHNAGPGLGAGSDADASTASEPGWLMRHLLSYGIDYWQVGSLCLVLNCLCMGVYTNLQIPTLKRFPAPASLSAMSIFVGAVALVVTAGAGTVSRAADWALDGPGAIVSVVYAGALASGLNFSLQAWANQRAGPVLVAAYIPLQTVFATFMGVTILDDPLYLGSVMGAILILLGLYLVIWGQRLHGLANDKLVLTVPFSGETDTLEEPLLKSPLPNNITPIVSNANATPNYGTLERSGNYTSTSGFGKK